MNSQLRRKNIVNQIDIAENMSVLQLAEMFNVSVETIRRDLGLLENLGRIIRVHGGARSIQRIDVGELLKKRRGEYVENKQRIAIKALSLIERYMTIALDASSTDWFLAKIIPDMPLTVVTNSLEIVKELSNRPQIQMVCTGGDYCSRHSDFNGELANRHLRSCKIHISFISCFGINLRTGLWENSKLNAVTKHTMIDVAQRAVLLADMHKFDRISMHNMAQWSEIDMVISDDELDESNKQQLLEQGVVLL